MDAAPFAALRYNPSVAGDPATTSAPAYDDLERFTYARHRTASPYTVLELLAGEDADAGFSGAASTFSRWLRTDVLMTDPSPAYYVYEIHELRHGVPHMLRGILAAVAVEGDTMVPHEEVDPERVAARVRRLEAVPAELAPVFAVHTAGPPGLRAVLDARRASRPVIAFTDEVGTDHRVWAIRDPQALQALTSGLAEVSAVIADGHHRFAAAVQRARHDPAADRTLAYLVDAAAYGPQLLPVHRLVSAPWDELRPLLETMFSILPVPAEDLEAALSRQRNIAFGARTTDRHGFLLVARDEEALQAAVPQGHSEAWLRLDTAIWEHSVRPLLGDVAVAYRSDLVAAGAEVDDGAGVLFVLRPCTLDEVFACALARESMPPKSTWFRPKPRAGLVMRSVDSRA